MILASMLFATDAQACTYGLGAPNLQVNDDGWQVTMLDCVSNHSNNYCSRPWTFDGAEHSMQVDTSGYAGDTCYVELLPLSGYDLGPGLHTDFDLIVEDGFSCGQNCVGASDQTGFSTTEHVSFIADGGNYNVTVENFDTIVGPLFGCGEQYAIIFGCTGSCTPPDVSEVVTCSTTLSTENTAFGSNSLDYYQCGNPDMYLAQPNPELIYEFQAPASGPVTFTISNMTSEHDLYVLDASIAGCHPDSCSAVSTQFGTNFDQVTFSAVQGRTYYIVIEAWDFTGTFDFDFDDGQGGCPEDCSNGVDDDGDSLIDCQDPDCGCTEDCTNGVDDDSDGDIDCDDSQCSTHPSCLCGDGDNDGYDDASCGGTDCNDSNNAVNPGATEVCNGIDDNCNTSIDEGVETTYFRDTDADGFGDTNVSQQACSAPPGSWATADGDCDDLDNTAFPGNPEAPYGCDGVDNNCNSTIDEGQGPTWYRDSDNDSYGDPATGTQQCASPAGVWVQGENTDCDDTLAVVNPGAQEVCDTVDNDCDGLVDLDDPDNSGQGTYYRDFDNDGYGDATQTIQGCGVPSGYSLDDTDCNDADNTIYPGAAEIPYDGIDQDCVAGDQIDVDGDGFPGGGSNPTDCNDNDVDVNPNGVENPDGRDENCDGRVDDGTINFDDDGDGVTEVGGDCDDASPTTAPGAAESCDGADNDCDGTIDEGTDCFDDDGDCFCEAGTCAGSLNGACTTVDPGDCADGDADVSPDETENTTNGIDDDCDGAVDLGVDDPDADGYTTTEGGDCGPEDPTVYPDAPELDDGIDNDCDGIIDEGTDTYDDDGDGASEDQGDCNDTDPDISPTADETDNGVDDDCDGMVDEGGAFTDDDGDGFSEFGGDCDDEQADLYPSAEEVENGLDDDCDGEIDEDFVDIDRDGVTEEDGDCDDADGWVSPDQDEVCDGVDNNCDGEIDENCDLGATAKPNPGGCTCSGGGSAPVGLLPLLTVLLVRRRC